MNEIEAGRWASGRTDARATAAAARDAGPGDIDLTGVDAVHWAETRERVAILRAWCGTSRHPRSEAVAAAARMGVTVSHFYRLVAVWKKHQEARLVSGHASRRGDRRETQTIARDARAIMSRIIDQSGPEARFLIGRFAHPGVPALIEQALPNIARYASHGLVTTNRYYLYTEVRRRLGFDHVQMAKFKAHPDLVARHISAPAKRQLIQYDADYIDLLSGIVEEATTARSVSRALRLPVYGVEQLCLDGLLEVEDHFVARIATDEMRIRGNSVARLKSRIVAAATARPAPAGGRPLLLAADRVGGGPKPWSAIVAAMVGGSMPFWTTRPMRDLGDVLVRPNDLAPFRRARVELRKLPGGPSQHLSQLDAAEMLNIKPSDLVHVADALVQGADSKGRALRSSVEALADRVAWPGEIAWHLGVSPQKVRRLMREEGIGPAATGWDRSQLREAGLLPL